MSVECPGCGNEIEDIYDHKKTCLERGKGPEELQRTT